MSDNVPGIAILCGGLGLRMGPVGSVEQKCMLMVEGQPILKHLFDQIGAAFGQANIVLLAGFGSASIRSHFGDRHEELRLMYSPDTTEGIRVALLSAENILADDHFLVVAGDTIIHASELSKLVANANREILGTMLLSTQHEIAPTHAFVQMQNRKVERVIFPPTGVQIGADIYSYTTTGHYSRRLFRELRKYQVSNLAMVLSRSVTEGQELEGEICTTPWFHFASPEDLEMRVVF